MHFTHHIKPFFYHTQSTQKLTWTLAQIRKRLQTLTIHIQIGSLYTITLIIINLCEELKILALKNLKSQAHGSLHSSFLTDCVGHELLGDNVSGWWSNATDGSEGCFCRTFLPTSTVQGAMTPDISSPALSLAATASSMADGASSLHFSSPPQFSSDPRHSMGSISSALFTLNIWSTISLLTASR